MYVNSNALAQVLLVLMILLTVGVIGLISHAVWIARLSLSLELEALPPLKRTLLVLAALLTPFVSFYAVQIYLLVKRPHTGSRPAIKGPIIALVTGVLCLCLSSALRVEMSSEQGAFHWSHFLELFKGHLMILTIGFALIIMTVHVFGGRHLWLYGVAILAFILAIVCLTL